MIGVDRRQRRGADQRGGDDRGRARAVLDRAVSLHRWEAHHLERRHDVGRVESGSAALPQVVWSTKDLDLTISAFAAGAVDSSVLYARYRITNNSRTYKKLMLFLAIRPLQVNPPWQFLNLAGGVARVDSISLQGSSAHVTWQQVRALARLGEWVRRGDVRRGEYCRLAALGKNAHFVSRSSIRRATPLPRSRISSSSGLTRRRFPSILQFRCTAAISISRSFSRRARSGYAAPPTQVVAPQPGAVAEPSVATAPGITLLPGKASARFRHSSRKLPPSGGRRWGR